ncbi:hypothetical protein [Salinigranum sp.]|uniref:hypothetical protein n=1 Tax=Salinigranum sp. TaxID=1966351 RepID=UPI003569A7DF
MTPNTRPSHVAEWAELVGDSVPDAVNDSEEADPSPSAAERSDDAAGRWADARTPSNGQ